MKIFHTLGEFRLIGCLLLGIILSSPLGVGAEADSPVMKAEKLSPKAEQPDSPETALQNQLQRELGEAAVPEEQNPFLLILQQMQEAEMLLGRGETGQRTQRIQRMILAELDALIARAQQGTSAKISLSSQAKPMATPHSSESSPPSGSPQEGPSGQPKEPTAKAPTGVAPGEEKTAEVQQFRSLLEEVWGLLPQRQREQMLETPIEEFLPKYKPLIIEYFRRLSELRAAGAPKR